MSPTPTRAAWVSARRELQEAPQAAATDDDLALMLAQEMQARIVLAREAAARRVNFWLIQRRAARDNRQKHEHFNRNRGIQKHLRVKHGGPPCERNAAAFGLFSVGQCGTGWKWCQVILKIIFLLLT